MQNLLADNTWYQLFIPSDELNFDSYEKVRIWQEIARLLLRKYVKHYYNFRKMEWEGAHLEYSVLDETNQNFPRVDIDGHSSLGYSILVDSTENGLIEKIQQTKKDIENGELKQNWKLGGIEVVTLNQHLYDPLLALYDEKIKVNPIQLNKGESQFVKDLKKYCESKSSDDLGYDIYLYVIEAKGKELDSLKPEISIRILFFGRSRVIFSE